MISSSTHCVSSELPVVVEGARGSATAPPAAAPDADMTGEAKGMPGNEDAVAAASACMDACRPAGVAAGVPNTRPICSASPMVPAPAFRDATRDAMVSTLER